jgi:hypothetical protein
MLDGFDGFPICVSVLVSVPMLDELIASKRVLPLSEPGELLRSDRTGVQTVPRAGLAILPETPSLGSNNSGLAM